VTADFLSHLLLTIHAMNEITLLASSAIGTDSVAMALALLADLGPEIVARCQDRCEFCGRAREAAAA